MKICDFTVYDSIKALQNVTVNKLRTLTYPTLADLEMFLLKRLKGKQQPKLDSEKIKQSVILDQNSEVM